jgi:5-amino-6-(5-phospho-D-ribitylamino)uracil phosphatase
VIISRVRDISNTHREASIKSQYKLLVLDVDGTLVNKQGEIAEADRLALAEAQRAGVIISLCTGRIIGACKKVLDRLELKGPHIFFDGAIVYDITLRKPLYEQPIPPEIVDYVCKQAIKDNIPLDLFSFSTYFATERSWRTELRRNLFGIEATVEDFKTLWKRENIIRGGIILNTPEDKSRVEDFGLKIGEFLSLSWSTIPHFPQHHFVNVLYKGVSKGRALEALVAHLGIAMEEVIAIGDGMNDISLLSNAGLAVAMQNAPDSLKSYADQITADVEHCGVAEAVIKYLL